jgi:DNA polymerase delta subunit 1
MCYSTLILPGCPEPPPDQIYEIETGLGKYRFSQVGEGIVPKLLENLAVWRKDAKKKMAECKAAGDAMGTAVYDGRQLAYKISANSVYGFIGASRGFLPCVPIAAAVTATGTVKSKHVPRHKTKEPIVIRPMRAQVAT